MTHQYPIGTWITFIDICKFRLVIDAVCYQTQIHSHPQAVPGYITRGGYQVKECDILEARLPKGQQP